MITLKIEEVTCVWEDKNNKKHYDMHYLECKDIYAYSFCKTDGTLRSFFYSLKSDEEQCGIRKYQVDLDKCKYIVVNGKTLWEKDFDKIVDEMIEEERIEALKFFNKEAK